MKKKSAAGSLPDAVDHLKAADSRWFHIKDMSVNAVLRAEERPGWCRPAFSLKEQGLSSFRLRNVVQQHRSSAAAILETVIFQKYVAQRIAVCNPVAGEHVENHEAMFAALGSFYGGNRPVSPI